MVDGHSLQKSWCDSIFQPVIHPSVSRKLFLEVIGAPLLPTTHEGLSC